MDRYIGTKIILAEPMEAHEFALKKNRGPNAPELSPEIDSLGHSQPGYIVQYEDNYVSWSPKEVFERAYRRISDAEVKLLAIVPHYPVVEHENGS